MVLFICSPSTAQLLSTINEYVTVTRHHLITPGTPPTAWSSLTTSWMYTENQPGQRRVITWPSYWPPRWCTTPSRLLVLDFFLLGWLYHWQPANTELRPSKQRGSCRRWNRSPSLGLWSFVNRRHRCPEKTTPPTPRENFCPINSRDLNFYMCILTMYKSFKCGIFHCNSPLLRWSDGYFDILLNLLVLASWQRSKNKLL